MKKSEILEKIRVNTIQQKENILQNRMGISESNYDPYYLLGKCYDVNELSSFSESELNNLIKFSMFATEAFY